MEIEKEKIVKSNKKEFPVLEVIHKRRSKRAFDSKPIGEELISSLFEAARWAPSSMNEQPWSYIYARNDQPDLFNKLLEALNESNRVWAKDAPLLILSMARTKLLRNGEPNDAALYDVGAANALLSLQATSHGLNVRQMGGFDFSKIVGSMNIPDSHQPIVILAIGYPGEPELLPEHLMRRELGEPERYVQEFFVKNDSF